MVAIYARISVRHQDRKDLSIQNQIAICKKYTGDQKECQVFADYGYSGKDFERPGFKRMMKEVYRGKIQCILVKDLSRLGRDYLLVGEYLEKIFPTHRVRFIAISEGYDSENILCSTNQYTIKNLLNEWYRRDISQKVFLVKAQQKQNGNYMGSHPRYGYQIKKKGNQRILWPCAAIGVRFAVCFLLVRGYSSSKIALWLSINRINTPAEYEKSGRLFRMGDAIQTTQKIIDIQAIDDIQQSEQKNSCYIGGTNKIWGSATVRKMGQQGV